MHTTVSLTHRTHVHVYLDTPNTNKPQALIIFIPGLLETADTPLFVNTTKALSRLGKFATARINSITFYGTTSTLDRTSISGQVQEIEDLLTHFRKTFDHVTLVAHSMGAFVSLLADISVVDSLIMWDPSLHPRKIFASTLYSEPNGNYYDTQLKRVVSTTLAKELPLLQDIQSVANNIKCPVGIISAGRGAVSIVDAYTQHLPNLLGHITIQDADHDFSDPQHTDRLINETLHLIQKAASQRDGYERLCTQQ